MRRSPRYALARARCTECGKVVACDVPRHGTVDVYRRHVTPEGERCWQSRVPVPPEARVRDAAGTFPERRT